MRSFNWTSGPQTAEEACGLSDAVKVHREAEFQRRIDVADEMLARLIDDIGTGSGVASLRRQAQAIKSELRGIASARPSTTA